MIDPGIVVLQVGDISNVDVYITALMLFAVMFFFAIGTKYGPSWALLGGVLCIFLAVHVYNVSQQNIALGIAFMTMGVVILLWAIVTRVEARP